MSASEKCLRFVPSRVKDLPDVTQATIFPDRLELVSAESTIVLRFADIARWARFTWIFRPIAQAGYGIHGWPLVGDRDWFCTPPDRFFRFYTEPPLTVYMPEEPPKTEYGQTTFRRMQEVMEAGGFGTYDLG